MARVAKKDAMNAKATSDSPVTQHARAGPNHTATVPIPLPMSVSPVILVVISDLTQGFVVLEVNPCKAGA